jgi:hypothetical protein
VAKKKLDKKTLRWCAKRIRKWARRAEEFGTRPLSNSASTVTCSRREAIGRSFVLYALADEIDRKQDR